MWGAGAGAVSWLCTCIDALQVLFWPTAGVKGCTACVHTFVPYNVLCATSGSQPTIDHCFSMFQRATHTIVVLDTAWPWASEAYGL